MSNTAFEPISGAQVTVAGSSLSTVTDVAGRFELSGNFGTAATVQVAKDGYEPRSQDVTLRACVSRPAPCEEAHPNFVLNTVAPALDITGDYSMRIAADPACVDLPAEARERTFTAAISSASPDRTRLDVQIGGASLYVDGIDLFSAGVAGDRFVLKLHGSWVNQAFMEEVAPNTYVGFNGTAAATVVPGASTISAAFDGTITHCRTRVRLNEPFDQCVDAFAGPAASQPESFVACQSKNHRMLFTGR